MTITIKILVLSWFNQIPILMECSGDRVFSRHHGSNELAIWKMYQLWRTVISIKSSNFFDNKYQYTTNIQQVENHMKKYGFSRRPDINFSVKWSNLKRHFLKLSVSGTDPSMAKERQAWPCMESIRKILKNYPTVTLENVTVVVDSVKVKVTHIQT
jgi:hypothetical protein